MGSQGIPTPKAGKKLYTKKNEQSLCEWGGGGFYAIFHLFHIPCRGELCSPVYIGRFWRTPDSAGDHSSPGERSSPLQKRFSENKVQL